MARASRYLCEWVAIGASRSQRRSVNEDGANRWPEVGLSGGSEDQAGGAVLCVVLMGKPRVNQWEDRLSAKPARAARTESRIGRGGEEERMERERVGRAWVWYVNEDEARQRRSRAVLSLPCLTFLESASDIAMASRTGMTGA